MERIEELLVRYAAQLRSCDSVASCEGAYLHLFGLIFNAPPGDSSVDNYLASLSGGPLLRVDQVLQDRRLVCGTPVCFSVRRALLGRTRDALLQVLTSNADARSPALRVRAFMSDACTPHSVCPVCPYNCTVTLNTVITVRLLATWRVNAANASSPLRVQATQLLRDSPFDVFTSAQDTRWLSDQMLQLNTRELEGCQGVRACRAAYYELIGGLISDFRNGTVFRDLVVSQALALDSTMRAQSGLSSHLLRRSPEVAERERRVYARWSAAAGSALTSFLTSYDSNVEVI